MPRWIQLLCLFLLLGLSAGCGFLRTSPNSQPAPVRKAQGPSPALLVLFPQTQGTVWVYEGFAEYGHRMTLDSVAKSKKKGYVLQTISGDVDDMSDGESDRDFHFRLSILFTGRAVYENILQADTPFPHTLQGLKLLQLPLEKGAKWRQLLAVRGKRSVMQAEILEVRKDSRSKTTAIRVRYRLPMAGMPNGVYEETREFRRGMGLYRFEKTFGPNPTDLFNYTLREVITPKQK